MRSPFAPKLTVPPPAFILSLILSSFLLVSCDESGSSSTCSDGPLPIGETPPV